MLSNKIKFLNYVSNVKYKMYYINMLKSNLLLGGSTNIRLSSSAYDVLLMDCNKYGFLRNGKENISFIISKLIKELTEYRSDLHEELLKNNNYDKKIVKTIENNIFNIYLKTMNYVCDDSYVNVGYRVNNEFKADISVLFYEMLEKFDMDFTSYVRSIIYEYCSRADLQRELFLNYSLVKQIRKAIKKELIVNIINDGIQNDLVIVSIEPTEYGCNYLLGITPDKEMCYFLPLYKTERLKITKSKFQINQGDYNKIVEHFNKFIEGLDWCLDL